MLSNLDLVIDKCHSIRGICTFSTWYRHLSITRLLHIRGTALLRCINSRLTYWLT